MIRVSGPATRFVLETIAGGVPLPRRLVLRTLVDPHTAETLDKGLVVWMPAPASFTGEDQAELHLHGGLAVRSAVLRALGRIEGCRLAEPGEFTRRAFLAGKFDLSAVEGLADLIVAETEVQRRQALRQLEGRLGQLVESWRERLIDGLARLEASLDFSDEGDVGPDLEAHVLAEAEALRLEIGRHLADGGRGERLRDGFVVVLAGAPNAGKSTLLNALARREVAIVSETPGTTRDAIEVRCDLGGLPVVFVDTAGIRDAREEIERQGIARAKAQLARADLVLWLVAPDAGNGHDHLTENVAAEHVIRVGTKHDLGIRRSASRLDLEIAAQTGHGLTELLDLIENAAERALAGDGAVITRERHRSAFERAHESLDRVPVALRDGQPELAAEDLRLALRAIGSVTGRVDVEHILDRLFASFCIGK